MPKIKMGMWTVSGQISWIFIRTSKSFKYINTVLFKSELLKRAEPRSSIG